MKRTQQTALAASALTVGAALITRGLRAARAFDFGGRSVVITGASCGLGLLIARELGREGARVTLAARNEDELERARQDLRARRVDVAIARCDISRRDEAEQLIATTIERTGSIDVLINKDRKSVV